jgi:hypothetical protein
LFLVMLYYLAVGIRLQAVLLNTMNDLYKLCFNSYQLLNSFVANHQVKA